MEEDQERRRRPGTQVRQERGKPRMELSKGKRARREFAVQGQHSFPKNLPLGSVQG